MVEVHGEVVIDKTAELEIIEAAFEGLEYAVTQTEDMYAREDALVILNGSPDGLYTSLVVECKDRQPPYDYAYFKSRGPMVERGKLEALAGMPADRAIVVWRTADGYLIGADADTALREGKVKRFERRAGNRQMDRGVEKVGIVIPFASCWVRPPLTSPNAFGRLTRKWYSWLTGYPLDKVEVRDGTG